MGTTPPNSDHLQRLVDRQAIERLLYDYTFHLDMNHPLELAALFVEDCEVIYGPNFGAVGREAYAKTLEGIGSYFVCTSHHVSNVVVDFDGDDQARVRAVVYAWHRYTRERPDSHVYGQYHDIVVREAGVWRFKRRELRVAGHKDFHVKESMPIGRA
ncbi:nuclear transport factor 2 family protein [Comamonadaceae bacterium G21597-S1]|nr:nuclear transport factor 2 family protein [Comamonadaceae bacterium G21597-S1]